MKMELILIWTLPLPLSCLKMFISDMVSILTFFFACRVQEHGGEPIIPFSGALERNLADMLPDEAEKYCEENKVQRLVEHMNLNYFVHVS